MPSGENSGPAGRSFFFLISIKDGAFCRRLADGAVNQSEWPGLTLFLAGGLLVV